MIFVTVGTQLPFDRLIKAVDQIAGQECSLQVFAQIGPSEYKPQHIEYSSFISPDEFDVYYEKADLVLAHAGMGSILTALEKKKPIVVFPRKASLREHRNDHQLATAKWLEKSSLVTVVYKEKELKNYIVEPSKAKVPEFSPSQAYDELLETVCSFING